MAAIWQNRIIRYSEEAPDQLLANPRNWRTHPGSQADALRGVLADVGWVQNVVASATSGFLIDGHLRVMEALKAGQPTIPVTWVDLSPEEESLILATLDPLSAMAGTDAAQLDALLRDVSTDSPAVQAMLDALAIEAGIVPSADALEDEPAEVAQDGPTRCQPGDVWQVGRHTIACLDSTDAENVRRVVGGANAGMVWADPPYGVRAVEDSNRLKELGYRPVLGDSTTDVARRAVNLYLPLSDVQVWWGANYYADALPPSKCWVVWDKDHHGMDFADAELAWVRDDQPVRCFRHAWSGADRDSEKGVDRVHPNQKPIALCVWAFEKYGAAGDVILDPFLGSGPSLKAAEALDRTVIGFELSPHYCDHILEWAEAHGLPVEKC